MSLGKYWNRFWFESSPVGLIPYFRIGVGLTTFLFFLFRLSSYRLRYTPEGYLGADTLALVAHASPFHWLPYDMRLIPFAYAAVLLFSLTLTLGICGRISALGCLLAQAYLLLTTPFGPIHVENLLPHWLFALTFCDSCRSLSLLPSRDERHSWGKYTADLTSAGTRLIQIQLCIIYHYAAVQKLQFPSWQSGEALSYLMQWEHLPVDPFRFLEKAPLLLSVLSLGTVLFEGSFPFLIWFGKARKPMMTLGLFFHIGIAVLLRLPFFSAATLAAYVLFLRQEDVESFLGRSRYTVFLR